MRVMVAAFLMGGLFCTPLLAAEKPPVDAKPAATKEIPVKPKAETEKTVTAKPLAQKPVMHVPANRPVDYGDMRCAFAVRHRDMLDSQIVAWAGGFIEGYAKANPEHVGSARSIGELTDPTVLRTHIRGYCLKHREKSVGAAVLAMVPHPPRASDAPVQRPAAPKP